jgi:hypothetical protein
LNDSPLSMKNIIELTSLGEGNGGEVDFRHMVTQRNIVGGQKVNPVKKERARELRRDMTPEEKILWHYLRNRQMAGFKFRRQQVIDGFITDYYCHEIGMILEIVRRRLFSPHPGPLLMKFIQRSQFKERDDGVEMTVF